VTDERTAAIRIETIAIDAIAVENPRERNRASFEQLVDSIARVGLKRPITVARAAGRADGKAYELVCGQGRLEAFLALGEREIPAIVEDLAEEERMLHSVVENIARRQHRPLEFLREIGALRERGHSDSAIARKTGLSVSYVQMIGTLLSAGEERLMVAVETGQIPLNVAVTIASVDHEGAQAALAEAYESGALRGRKLLEAKRLVEQRQRKGKAYYRYPPDPARKRVTSEALVRAYEAEADRQRLMVKRAEVTRNRLLFLVTALRTLYEDAHFVTLLRAEKLDTLPRPLAALISGEEG
jgi:ParB family chromosome partitioning protein